MANLKFPTDYTDVITIPDADDKFMITDSTAGEALKRIFWSSFPFANVPCILGQAGNSLNIAGIGISAFAALSPTRVAFIDDALENLRAYDFDGTNWTTTGNPLNIAGIGSPALAAVSSTSAVFIDATLANLRTYDFDGTNWTAVGNPLNIVGAGWPALAAISSTRVAFVDATLKNLTTYSITWGPTAPYQTIL